MKQCFIYEKKFWPTQFSVGGSPIAVERRFLRKGERRGGNNFKKGKGTAARKRRKRKHSLVFSHIFSALPVFYFRLFYVLQLCYSAYSTVQYWSEIKFYLPTLILLRTNSTNIVLPTSIRTDLMQLFLHIFLCYLIKEKSFN